jgi:2-oxoglutarate/2-oxoacid ferredoxin oxidoreductase subunit beta
MSTITNDTTPREKKGHRSDLKPVWCPGCGDYGVIAGLDQALQALEYESHRIVFVSGIGCSSRLPYFFNTYGFHTIHGRAAAVALGVKVANPDLRVIVVGGDGDFFSIGTNHFIHTARRNLDVLAICMDNNIYGLTKGQTSPTSELHVVTGSSPYGSVETPLNPLLLALTAGATFVAQSYSANVKHLKQTLIDAERHPGFSFVNVISPCHTFNKEKTFAYYKSRVSVTEDEARTDLGEAYNHILGNQGKTVLGTFYQVHRPTYDGSQAAMAHAAAEREGVPTMEELLESFA